MAIQINSVTIMEANPRVKDSGITDFLYGESQLHVTIDATPKNEITECITVIEENDFHPVGPYYGYETYYEDDFVTGKLTPMSTNLTFVVEVKGRRGEIATKRVPVTLTGYKGPYIMMDVERCDSYGTPTPSGTAIKISLNGSVGPINGQNYETLTLRWRSVGEGNVWQNKVWSNYELSWDFSVEHILQNMANDVSYEFEATIEDRLYSATVTSQEGNILMSRYAGGKGVKFFGEATSTGFYIGDVRYDLTWQFLRDHKENSLQEWLVKLFNDTNVNYFRGTAGQLDYNLAGVRNRVTELEKKEQTRRNKKTEEIRGIGTGECLHFNPDQGLAFIRMYYTPQNLADWTVGSEHLLGTLKETRPSVITALACHSGKGNYTAKMDKDGGIKVFVKAKPSDTGYTIYVSGVFQL